MNTILYCGVLGSYSDVDRQFWEDWANSPQCAMYTPEQRKALVEDKCRYLNTRESSVSVNALKTFWKENQGNYILWITSPETMCYWNLLKRKHDMDKYVIYEHGLFKNINYPDRPRRLRLFICKIEGELK